MPSSSTRLMEYLGYMELFSSPDHIQSLRHIILDSLSRNRHPSRPASVQPETVPISSAGPTRTLRTRFRSSPYPPNGSPDNSSTDSTDSNSTSSRDNDSDLEAATQGPSADEPATVTQESVMVTQEPSDSENDGMEEAGKIPKPHGEVGGTDGGALYPPNGSPDDSFIDSTDSNSASGRDNDSDLEAATQGPSAGERATVTQEPSDSENYGMEEAEKIPKPRGEVGRPGGGGYHLERALGWPKAKFEQVTGFVRQQVLSIMDCAVPFTQQPEAELERVRAASVREFPWLSTYKDLWVIDDMVRSRLKYQRTAMRRMAVTAVAGP
ncbi:hypothetical protein AAF712_008652 [Marasmius tenuissimus]|uniref:Uncharacterized protein n=1 Tax=Marasmius tenuissimus TaxID=585030 RepID=A0ABR2ZRP7_9AGAR